MSKKRPCIHNLYTNYFSLDTATIESKGFVIETIVAIDLDQDDNGVLTFSLEQDSSDFEIDSVTGIKLLRLQDGVSVY